MRNATRLLGLSLICLLAAAGPAAAAEPAAGLIDATDPARVLAVAQAHGEAVLLTDGMGEPMIEASAGGLGYRLHFYDCTETRDCQTLMFQAAWEASEKLTDSKMAEWNREERFGKAFLDEKGRPTVELNVNLRGGVSPENLSDTFDWWRVVMERFVRRHRF